MRASQIGPSSSVAAHAPPHPALRAIAALIVMGTIVTQYDWWAGALAALLAAMSWTAGILHERDSSPTSELRR